MGQLTALVTDGDQRPALAIVRSLGRRNISVIVAAETDQSLASQSRYCARHVRYPSPYHYPEAFRNFLLDLVRSTHVDVVIPVTDVTTPLVARHHEELSRYTTPAAPDFAAFEYISNKPTLLRRAAECGIPTPRTHFVVGSEDLKTVLPLVEYPAVIKPQRSRISTRSGIVPTVVHYANSEAELLSLYNAVEYLSCYPSMIQERVVGEGTGIFVLCSRGRLLTAFAHRRLREKPPSGGASVFCESIAADPELVDQAMRLLSPVGWHGVAMIEYKHSQRLGRPVLMEVNGRYWGSLQLAIDAGVDFPYLNWQLAVGQPVEVPSGYTIGLRSRWLLGDFDHLLVRLFQGDGQQHLPIDAPTRLQSAVAFVTTRGTNVHYDVIDHTDQRPALFEVGQYTRTLVGSVMRLVGRVLARFGTRTPPRRSVESQVGNRNARVAK